MAARISQRVNIPYDYCLSAVNELQANAIEKLKSRDTFKDTGKVKVQEIIFSFFVILAINVRN